MFCGLFESKYYKKCKSLIKRTETRVHELKKRSCSNAEFLKNIVMATLLRDGSYYNAYCRAEELLVEQKMIACYNFIEQFCGCISSNLTLMNKQRECPAECREAVQSLKYAAARIGKLPELRYLRTLFTERYGDCPEDFVNEKFVETLEPRPAAKEMKLQVMHDIATEFNLEWKPQSLEQKLLKPPSSAQDYQHRDMSLSNADDKAAGYQWKKKDDDDDEKCSNIPIRHSSEDEVFSSDRRDSTDMDGVRASSSSVGSVSEDEINSKKPFYYKFIPPPYVRTKRIKEESKIEHSSPSDGNVIPEETTHRDDLLKEAKPKPKSVWRRPVKLTQPQENTEFVETPLKPPPGRQKFLCNASGGWFGKPNAGAEKEAAAKLGWRFAQEEDGDDKSDREMMSGHVHPKLPDYDDLAARVAALNRR